MRIIAILMMSGRRALDGRVHGIALGVAPHHGVAAVDVGQISAAPELGLNIAFLARCLLAFLDEIGHFGISLEIGIYERLGL